MTNQKLRAFEEYMRIRLEFSDQFTTPKSSLEDRVKIAMKHKICNASGELIFDALHSMQEYSTFSFGWDSALKLAKGE